MTTKRPGHPLGEDLDRPGRHAQREVQREQRPRARTPRRRRAGPCAARRGPASYLSLLMPLTAFPGPLHKGAGPRAHRGSCCAPGPDELQQSRARLRRRTRCRRRAAATVEGVGVARGLRRGGVQLVAHQHVVDRALDVAEHAHRRVPRVDVGQPGQRERVGRVLVRARRGDHAAGRRPRRCPRSTSEPSVARADHGLRTVRHRSASAGRARAGW